MLVQIGPLQDDSLDEVSMGAIGEGSFGMVKMRALILYRPIPTALMTLEAILDSSRARARGESDAERAARRRSPSPHTLLFNLISPVTRSTLPVSLLHSPPPSSSPLHPLPLVPRT